MSSLPNTPLAKSINDFLQYLEVERGSSPLTIRNYHHYLSRFANWIYKKNPSTRVTDINASIVRDFRVYLSRLSDGKGGTLSRRTQGYHAIAIRSFLRWLTKNDQNVMAADKIELPKVAERQVKFLNGEQVERLLNAPNPETVTGKRDKAILETLYSTGLRVSELSKLDIDSIDLDRREFGIIGKGGRGRVVFLSKRASEYIDSYLLSRNDPYKPLFIRHKGKIEVGSDDEDLRLSVRSIQRILKKYSKKVKLPVIATPHVLRHSFATDLLRAGADIRSVQDMLGHKNIQTTQIYTHVTHRQLRDVHQAFHGKGGTD